MVRDLLMWEADQNILGCGPDGNLTDVKARLTQTRRGAVGGFHGILH